MAGHDLARDPEAVKASIGYMSQKFSLYLDLPVRENLAFFGGAYGLEGAALQARADEVLALADLRGLGEAITGELPGGLRQRLALACAILHRPQVVFLDEPTAGVDPVARRTFWRLIRDLARAGTTVFVTTHYLDEAEYCRRIGLMVDGKLVALDTPAALKRHLGAGAGAGGPRAGASAGPPRRWRPGPGSERDPLRRRAPRARRAGQPRAGGGRGGCSPRRRRAEVRVEPAEPSLEDVFLAVVGNGHA